MRVYKSRVTPVPADGARAGLMKWVGVFDNLCVCARACLRAGHDVSGETGQKQDDISEEETRRVSIKACLTRGGVKNGGP